MKPETHYQPRKGDTKGPLFVSMTEASLWVIQQSDQSEWFVELVRTPLVAAESFEEFRTRKDAEQAEADEQREVEASQLVDFKAWRHS